MSTDSSVTAALPSLRSAASGVAAEDAHPRHALPGDWVRPFGSKVTALQRRRRSTESARRAANGAVLGGLSLSTADATLAFQLMPTAAGLLIERTWHRPTGTVLRQAMLLTDHRDFEQWCEGDPVRFDDPVLWARLRRYGDDVFGPRR